MAVTVKLVMVQRGGGLRTTGDGTSGPGTLATSRGTVTDLARNDHRYAPGCLLVDTTAIPDEAVVVLGMSRPMVDVDLAPGMVRKLSGEIVQWDGGGARFIGTGAPAALQGGEAVAEVMVSEDPRATLEELGANPAHTSRFAAAGREALVLGGQGSVEAVEHRALGGGSVGEVEVVGGSGGDVEAKLVGFLRYFGPDPPRHPGHGVSCVRGL